MLQTGNVERDEQKYDLQLLEYNFELNFALANIDISIYLMIYSQSVHWKWIPKNKVELYFSLCIDILVTCILKEKVESSVGALEL